MKPAGDGSSARILLLGALLFLTASAWISTRLYGWPGSWLVRGSVGGFFYVLFWCFLGYLLFPGARPGAIALAVLAATCAIEFAQIWHPPFLEAARGTLAGGLLLGSVFSGVDFPWYFAGCGDAWLVGRALQ